MVKDLESRLENTQNLIDHFKSELTLYHDTDLYKTTMESLMYLRDKLAFQVNDHYLAMMGYSDLI